MNKTQVEEIIFEAIQGKLNYYSMTETFDEETQFVNIQMDEVDVVDISMDVEWLIEKQTGIKISLHDNELDKLITVQNMIDVFYERVNND